MIVIAVVAAALTLSGVVALGWMLSSDQRTALNATTSVPFAFADDAWAEGANRVWSAQIPAKAEIVVAGDYVVAVERGSGSGTSATLTAYSVSDEGASQVWSTTADLTSGVAGDYFPFQTWDGSTLVHGNTLIDLASGTVSAAPWSDQDRPVVLEDRVITCSSSGSCFGWKPGSSEPAWTTSIGSGHADLAGISVPGYVSVFHRGGIRYAYVGRQTVINIDTGATVPFALPSLGDWEVGAAADGWIIYSYDQGQWHLYEFGVGGGNATGDYSGTAPWGGDEVIINGPYSRTREQFRAIWSEGARTGIAGTAHFYNNNTSCYERFESVNGPSITIPTIAANGASNVISQTSSSCANRVAIGGTRVATVYLQNRPTENAFAFMYDASTGEAISFEGTDAQTGDQLSLVTARLIVGYDTDTGTLYGYTPAG